MRSRTKHWVLLIVVKFNSRGRGCLVGHGRRRMACARCRLTCAAAALPVPLPLRRRYSEPVYPTYNGSTSLWATYCVYIYVRIILRPSIPADYRPITPRKTISSISVWGLPSRLQPRRLPLSDHDEVEGGGGRRRGRWRRGYRG